MPPFYLKAARHKKKIANLVIWIISWNQNYNEIDEKFDVQLANIQISDSFKIFKISCVFQFIIKLVCVFEIIELKVGSEFIICIQ